MRAFIAIHPRNKEAARKGNSPGQKGEKSASADVRATYDGHKTRAKASLMAGLPTLADPARPPWVAETGEIH